MYLVRLLDTPPKTWYDIRMIEPHMSIEVTWTESYKSFLEIEIPPLFATSREAAMDYVKKAIKSKSINPVCLAIEQEIDKDKNKERTSILDNFELISDENEWWGPW